MVHCTIHKRKIVYLNPYLGSALLGSKVENHLGTLNKRVLRKKCGATFNARNVASTEKTTWSRNQAWYIDVMFFVKLHMFFGPGETPELEPWPWQGVGHLNGCRCVAHIHSDITLIVLDSVWGRYLQQVPSAPLCFDKSAQMSPTIWGSHVNSLLHSLCHMCPICRGAWVHFEMGIGELVLKGNRNITTSLVKTF